MGAVGGEKCRRRKRRKKTFDQEWIQYWKAAVTIQKKATSQET